MASARLRKVLASAALRVPHVIADGLGFAGAGAIAYGAWAGFLAGGVLLMALSILIGRKLERTTQ